MLCLRLYSILLHRLRSLAFDCYLQHHSVNEAQSSNESQDSHKYVRVSLEFEIHRFGVEDRPHQLSLGSAETYRAENVQIR